MKQNIHTGNEEEVVYLATDTLTVLLPSKSIHIMRHISPLQSRIQPQPSYPGCLANEGLIRVRLSMASQIRGI